MKTFVRFNARALVIAAAIGLLASSPAFSAASSVNDQVPSPVPSVANPSGNSEVLTQSLSVPGGMLYWNCARQAGALAGQECSGPAFVPTSLSGSFTRYLDLSGAREDTGLPPTGATGSTTAFGVARTTGTSYALVGAATSASAVTTKAMWETNVASTYVSGNAIPVVVNANYTGSGTVTAASTTITVSAYTEVGGVETAITGITAAQQFNGTAANYTFNIPSTAGLVPGQHVVIEAVMLVTTSAGAATGQINAVGVTD